METGPENWKNCSLEHLEKSRTHRVGSGGLLDMAGHDESPERTEKFSYACNRFHEILTSICPITHNHKSKRIWWMTELRVQTSTNLKGSCEKTFT